jgi:adenylate kinase
MNTLIIGVQGSGKGTQGKLLAKKLGIPHISSGEMFRTIDKNSEIGKKAFEYIDKGELVPLNIVTELFKQHLEKIGIERGGIIEGYPRNRKQAELLEEFFPLDKVILLNISDQEAIKRLTGRRTCSNPKCQAIYNIYTAPKPKKENICDKCGSRLEQRSDATEEAVKKRIEIYHKETEPLIEFYKNKGILIEINGEQSIEDVQADIRKQLKIR